MLEIFENLLSEFLTKGLITEDKKTEYTKSFKDAMKVFEERVYASASDKVDDTHIAKLNEVLDKIDTDVTEQTKSLIEKIKESHKLELTEAKDEKLEGLSDKVEEFLDVYLDECNDSVNTDETSSKLKRFLNLFEEIKQMLGVNDDYVQENIREAVLDGKNQIDSLTKQVDSLMLEKIESNKQLNMYEAKITLNEKTEGCSPKLKEFLKEHFKNSNKSEIEEKLDEAIKAYGENEKSVKDKILAESKSVNPVVIEEGQENSKSDEMSFYENQVKRMMRK